MFKTAALIALFMLSMTASFSQPATQAQSRGELERERAAIQKEIEDVKHSLDETKKNKKETLGQLALLQRKLRLRQSAIQNINGQITFIQNDMNQSWHDILKLRKELDTLRKQYEQSVVYAYKNRSNYDFLNFIFSATNFNDAVKRVAYLKSYRAYREERAANIVKTQSTLQSKMDGLKLKRQEKDEVLVKQNKEKETLEEEKKEKDVVVSKLQSREKELKKEMTAKQKQDQKLNGAIAAALRRARDEAMKEVARRKAADAKLAAAEASKANSPSSNSPIAPPTAKANSANNTPANNTPTVVKSLTVFDSRADVALSDNFEKNQHHLPWPIESGNVAMHFGMQEVLKNIHYNNNGITIETNSGVAVKAVFDGEVQSVFNVGDVSAVMLRHGRYFTTYCNLGSTTVTKGQKVKTGELLGRVSEIGQLEFILSDEKDNKFDPEKWLRKN